MMPLYPRIEYCLPQGKIRRIAGKVQSQLDKRAVEERIKAGFPVRDSEWIAVFKKFGVMLVFFHGHRALELGWYFSAYHSRSFAVKICKYSANFCGARAGQRGRA